MDTSTVVALDESLHEAKFASIVNDDSLWGPLNPAGYVTTFKKKQVFETLVAAWGWGDAEFEDEAKLRLSRSEGGYNAIVAPAWVSARQRDTFISDLLTGPVSGVAFGDSREVGIWLAHGSTQADADEFARIRGGEGSKVYPATLTPGFRSANWTTLKHEAGDAALAYESYKRSQSGSDTTEWVARAVELLEWPAAYAILLGYQVLVMDDVEPSEVECWMVLDRSALTIGVPF